MFYGGLVARRGELANNSGVEYIVPPSPERYAQASAREGEAAMGPSGGGQAAVARPPQPWVGFSVSSAGFIAGARARERYQLETARPLRGSFDTALWRQGVAVTRYEGANALPSAVAAGGLTAALEPEGGSAEREEKSLREAWAQSAGSLSRRVALLLPFSHGAAFWSLPKAERTGTFLGWEQKTDARPPGVMGRILRKLYRAHSKSAAGWDYLAYLEMLPTDVAHLREALDKLRDGHKNRLWAMVERAAELWMISQPVPAIAVQSPGQYPRQYPRQ